MKKSMARPQFAWTYEKKLHEVSFLVFLALTVSGCQFDPYSSEFATVKPKETDLVGQYAPNTDTIKPASEKSKYARKPMSIELEEDGTIDVSHIPNQWAADFGHPNSGSDSANGTWKIARHQKWWAIQVDFPATEEQGSAKRNGLVTEMMLVGDKPPYMIHFSVGDPETGDTMRFHKVKPTVSRVKTTEDNKVIRMRDSQRTGYSRPRERRF